jgi:hypothetical protein
MPQDDLRSTLLAAIADQQRQHDGSLQSGPALTEVRNRLGNNRGLEFEQGLLTAFSDLFRTGYLAWGLNLSNPNPPFFHTTERGRRALKSFSRDPSNPDGYLAHVDSVARLTPLVRSYLGEALACYVNDLPKAAAVMVGGAAESLALELRDVLCDRLDQLGRATPKGFKDWKIKVVVDAIYTLVSSHKRSIPRWEAVEGYWPAYIQQIRASRNDAGHPSSVDPVTIDTVHASLLIFPELARLAFDLRAWCSTADL